MKHKFINKKTGAEARVIAMYLDSNGVMQVDGYDTVEDLMGDYAAYEEHNPPKEPLIKDEKTRKAVKAWAEANGVGVVLYKRDNYRFYADDTDVGSIIDFEKMPKYIGLKHEHRYTIDELCGEEEENV